jgi:hypothetical protein
MYWGGVVFSPLGKWSLEATVLVWYPGEWPTPLRSSTTAVVGIFLPDDRVRIDFRMM